MERGVSEERRGGRAGRSGGVIRERGERSTGGETTKETEGEGGEEGERKKALILYGVKSLKLSYLELQALTKDLSESDYTVCR